MPSVDYTYNKIRADWLAKRDKGEIERDPIVAARTMSKAEFKRQLIKGLESIKPDTVAKLCIQYKANFRDMKSWLDNFEGQAHTDRLIALGESGINLEALDRANTSTHTPKHKPYTGGIAKGSGDTTSVIRQAGSRVVNNPQFRVLTEGDRAVQEYETLQAVKKAQTARGKKGFDVQLTETEKSELTQNIQSKPIVIK